MLKKFARLFLGSVFVFSLTGCGELVEGLNVLGEGSKNLGEQAKYAAKDACYARQASRSKLEGLLGKAIPHWEGDTCMDGRMNNINPVDKNPVVYVAMREPSPSGAQTPSSYQSFGKFGLTIASGPVQNYKLDTIEFDINGTYTSFGSIKDATIKIYSYQYGVSTVGQTQNQCSTSIFGKYPGCNTVQAGKIDLTHNKAQVYLPLGTTEFEVMGNSMNILEHSTDSITASARVTIKSVGLSWIQEGIPQKNTFTVNKSANVLVY